MKRFLIMVLCLLLALTFVLTSCDNADDGGTEETTAETTTASTGGDEVKEATIENWLPTESYGVDGGNREFKMLTCPDYNHNYYFFRTEEENGNPLASQASKRYWKINEVYDVALKEVEGSPLELLQASVMGGGGEFDLVYPHPTVDILAMMGLFENLYQYENLHLDQPWWSQSQVDAYTVGDKLYMAVSDFSLSGQGFVSLVFNRDIYNNIQHPEDLYDLVETNQWTMAKFRQISMLYGQDVDSNDTYDEKDKYGFIYQPQHTKNFYWALGGKIVDQDNNGQYYIAVNADQMSLMATELSNLAYNSDNKVWLCNSTVYATFAEQSTGWKTFKGQQGLFMTYDLGGLYQYLSEISFDIGYLPYPKLTVEQTSYPVVCAAGFFAIPQKAADPIMSSVILEALSIFSYSNYRPTFFNTILLGRMSEKPEDYEMLEFLHENKMFDIGFTFPAGDSDKILYQVVIQNRNVNVASLIKGRKREMQETLDIIEQIRNGDFT